MNKQYKRVMRIIDKHEMMVPHHCEGALNNVIAAADILSEKEIVQMLEDYGF